jgi:ABC-type glycerol-3-phosphate transport system permease component
VHPPETNAPADGPDPGEKKRDGHPANDLKTGADGMIALFVAEMSEQLTICLIAVAANLAGMVIIYAAMSNAVGRHRTLTTIVLILLSQLFWIAPALWIVETGTIPHAAAYGLWLGNWLVCGFSVVLFWKSAIHIPVSLADTARMDGLGSYAAWRHTVVPFVRRDLFLAGVFTVMATLLPVCGCLKMPEVGSSIARFESLLSPSGRLIFMAAVSALGAIPLLAIYFAAKIGATAAVPSPQR